MNTQSPNPSGFCMCGCGERAPIATQTDRKYGAVKGQPRKYINGHANRSSPVEYLVEDRGYKTPCHVWQRGKTVKGYGLREVKLADGTKKLKLVHRVAWEARNGPIPAGLQIDHLCRVTSCVRVDHLELVTPGQNIQRGKGAKLTPALVVEIRKAPKSLSGREIARRLGVSRTIVNDVRAGRTWKLV